MWSCAVLLALVTAQGPEEPIPSTTPAQTIDTGAFLYLEDAKARKRAFNRLTGATRRAVRSSLDWLAGHQEDAGFWDCDEFMNHDPDHDRCDGAGMMENDVGITALALLAFLASGDALDDGGDIEVIRKATDWLVARQDEKTGLIGKRMGHTFMYGHAIATIAVCEAAGIGGRTELLPAAGRAVDFALKARNPAGAWRYDFPPIGDNDTSITAWMTVALATARDLGIDVPRDPLFTVIEWLDEVTDTEIGRVGYDSLGSLSSRVQSLNDNFPPEKGEAMTAAGLLCRFLAVRKPKKDALKTLHTELILEKLPEWDPEGFGCDLYYWYYGTQAMHQMGGKPWKSWNRALGSALLKTQSKRGSSKGSWDPVGPWGYAGGRVYSTAIAALSLQTPTRHKKLVD